MHVVSSYLVDPIPGAVTFNNITANDVGTRRTPVPVADAGASLKVPVYSTVTTGAKAGDTTSTMLRTGSIGGVVGTRVTVVAVVDNTTSGTLTAISPGAGRTPRAFGAISDTVPPPGGVDAPRSMLTRAYFRRADPGLAATTTTSGTVVTSMSTVLETTPVFLRGVRLDTIGAGAVVIAVLNLFRSVTSSYMVIA